MQRYFFHLRNGECGFFDRIGIEFPTDDAAIDHARQVASELLKNREIAVRHWRLEARNSDNEQIFTTALFAYDRTLDHLHPSYRGAIAKLVDTRAALSEAILKAKATQRKSRALVSRSRGRPHLVVEMGEEI